MDRTRFKMSPSLDHSEMGLSFIMCSKKKKKKETQTSGIYKKAIM